MGLCIEKKIGLGTRVPRTRAIRQALEAWGHQQETLPIFLEKPGRTQQEVPRRWRGQSVLRRVDMEYTDGRIGQEESRISSVGSVYD